MTKKRIVVGGVLIVALAGCAVFAISALNKPTENLTVTTHTSSSSSKNQQSTRPQNRSRSDI